MRRLLILLAAFASLPALAAPETSIVDAVNANTTRLVTRGSKGPQVLRAQILLDRAHFAPGQIDGQYGSNLRQAIAGFQRSRGLKVTGSVDAATWRALGTSPAPALAVYVVQQADVAGPFQEVPEKMEDKAKLPALGFASALEGLAEKFHASPALLKRLNPDKDFALAGTQLIVPNVLGSEPLPKAGRVVVDKSDRTLMVFDTANKVVAQFPSSTGSEFDPLPIGRWQVEHVTHNPAFYYNPELFWDADPDETKTKVAPGPNNPVGVAWLDLNKPHYGIHGAPEPGSIGKTQSHGCIRLTNWDVALLATAVDKGTEVVLQE